MRLAAQLLVEVRGAKRPRAAWVVLWPEIARAETRAWEDRYPAIGGSGWAGEPPDCGDNGRVAAVSAFIAA